MTGTRVLLLAAGRGRRAGGPKVWRPYEASTLLEAHLDFFRGLVGPGALFVAIQDEWHPRCAALGGDARWVAADPEASPLSSLQRLIAASGAHRSFVLHVDMPIFEREVYETLMKTPGDAVVPVFEGRRGHPVLLKPSLLAEVARLDPAKDRLDAFLRSRAVVEVPVSSPAIHRNLNELTA